MTKYFTGKLSKSLSILGLALASAFAAHAGPPLKELVLYYPLTPVQDFSGNHNGGKIVGVVASNSPSLVSMQKSRQLTIAIWIKPASIPREFPEVISKGGNTSGTAYGGYEILLNANGDNDLIFISGSAEIDTHGANGRWINNHVGEWIHVAFTINDQTKIAKFYVNGVPTNDEFDYGTYFTAGTALNFDVPNNLYVGQRDPANSGNRLDFDGSMRELMIFNRALTATEVSKIYNSTKSAIVK